ncbi:MAG: DUF3592 domain-containing protein [Spirochaetes bacterium]|nr:DUF3592 domain-containing protein [Spirochaetota bacterium]
MALAKNALTDQRPPRRVTWEMVDWGRKLNIMFGMVWLIAWGTFMVMKEPPLWDHVILNRHGVTASARLVHIRRLPGTINRNPLYTIEISFKDRQGRAVNARLWSYDNDFMARLDPGRPVAVEYDPRKPSRCRFAGDTISIMDLLSVIFIAAGLGLFLTSYLSGRNRLQLLRNGTAASALVTRIRATSQSRKSGRIMVVRYEFTTDTGRQISGFYKTTAPPEEGKEIPVVYDPRRPLRNTTV